MKLNLCQCSSEIKYILMEVKEILDFTFEPDGFDLTTAQMEEKGFHLLKNEKQIDISYHTKTDFCRALLTMSSAEYIKTIDKREQSSFEEFGVMVDLSRNAVMNNQAIKQFIRLAALMGYQFVGLYMEDTIEVLEEPYFGYMRGALTAEELKDIDDYAELFGIEIRAYIQTLAHLNQIKRYECYNEIFDTDDILLAEEERVYELLEHVIQTISGNLRSRKINIGMDEAHMVGLGKYLDRHGFQERFKIMENHLNRVLTICRKYGYTVQMWSDMYFRLAYGGEYYIEDGTLPKIPAIPADVELVYWDYYSCEKEHYDKMLKQHKKLSKQIGYSGGAWKWTGFTPDNTFSIETGRAALKVCKENQVASVVITAWGDNGAEASAFSILPALYADAELAYGEDMDTLKFTNLTGLSFEQFMKIDLPSRFRDCATLHNNGSKYLFYNDVLLSAFDSIVFEGIAEFYEKVAFELDKNTANTNFGYIFDTQSKLCRFLQHKADFGIRLKQVYDNQDKVTLLRMEQEELPLMIEELEQFYDAVQVQWEKENKPFGFEVQCIRLGGLKQRLEYTKKVLHFYNSGKKEKIEELEVRRKPFHYYHEDRKNDGDINKLNYNLWNEIVSPAVIG